MAEFSVPARWLSVTYLPCEPPAQLQASDSQQAAGTMAAGIGQFVEDLLPDSFLRVAFGGFFRVLDEAGPSVVRRELAVEVAALKQQLQDSLGLQFEVEDLEDEDEDGPVIVEL